MSLKLLIIGDERKNRRVFNWNLSADGFHLRTASTRPAVTALLQEHAFQAVCIDMRMEEDEAFAMIDLVRRRVPRLPIVALLAERDRRVVARLREFRVDLHLVPPFTPAVLREALGVHAAPEPVASSPAELVDVPRVEPIGAKIVARDDAARRMIEIALRAATSNVSILILGETGTGKNVLAQAIHEQSPLRHKPFVTVSCPSLSRELLESDLFGHVRGAFTGAVQDTWGKVAAAEGGTLFLDEIGDLPPALQPKLLRLLQEKQYERIGETTPRHANVRIIAATNRDLKAEVAAGRFREDLFYRLNVITLEVPPLRCRPADVMVAAETFLQAICNQLNKPIPTFSPDARRLLEGYSWPGNLRELRNTIERAAVLSDAALLEATDFPSLLADRTPPRYQVGAAVSLRELETAHIQMVVANSPTLEEAARILEIDKSTLYRKRKAMEAGVERFAPAEEVAVGVGR
jgi:NtrC-family two-component system response regulator AlgB